MFLKRWKVIPGVRRGDWRSRLIGLAQGATAIVALLGLVTMITLNPFFLLAFAAAQSFLIVGMVLFVIAAIFTQRTLVLEEFDPEQDIIREGDPGRDVYIIKSGAVDVLRKRPDGSQEVIKRLGPGDYFGEMAVLRNARRNATVRAVTPVQVLSMSPVNFFSLYTHLPGLRDQIDKILQARLQDLKQK